MAVGLAIGGGKAGDHHVRLELPDDPHRVRENLQLRGRVPLEKLLNESVNQTLGRSVLTSGLTFIAVLCLYIFGGEVLRGFAFALVVGVVVGSYSTIFIASPIVLWWRNAVTVRGGGRAAARARGRA